MASKKPGGVRKFVTPAGTVRWEYTVQVTARDATRHQERRRFTTRAAADAAYSKVRHAVNEGTHVVRWDGTLAELAQSFIASKSLKAGNTVVSYQNALAPALAMYGSRKARSITSEDVERLRDFMMSEGRRRGGTAGTALSARTVRMAVAKLSSAYKLGIRRGLLAVNPCETVDLPPVDAEERPVWDEQQVRAYLAEASKHRLHLALRLAVLAFRRGEVAGLQWSDLDLGDHPTLTVNRARVVVNGDVVEKSPKTRNGTRTVDLDPVTADAARTLLLVQMDEKLALGSAYCDGGYVIADEAGMPFPPAKLSDLFLAVSKAAGLPRIRLHDARHTALTIMVAAGVPISDVSKYAGHHSAAFTLSKYVHGKSNAAGAMLGDLYAAPEQVRS